MEMAKKKSKATLQAEEIREVFEKWDLGWDVSPNIEAAAHVGKGNALALMVSDPKTHPPSRFRLPLYPTSGADRGQWWLFRALNTNHTET
jgi:hypothetical protein